MSADKLPDGCGYTGIHFGANYVDAECFGGRLYDLDDGDEDDNGDTVLYEPDEYIPCPQCRPDEFKEWKKASDQ